MAEWLAEDETSRPQPEPIISEADLRRIFGLGTNKRQLELGEQEVLAHLRGLVTAAEAALELTKMLGYPASSVGKQMDLRNLDTELEAIKQHTIAARCLVQEMRKRVG